MSIRQDFAVELDDGRTFTVSADNRDMCRWDKSGQGSAQEHPFIFNTFVAWSALARTGQLDGMPFNVFEASCVSALPAEAVEVDPTLPDRSPD